MISATDVGRAMARLRGARTQREVARRAGIHRTSWSSYETGTRLPSRKSQAKIAAGLGCSLAELDHFVLQEYQRTLQQAGPTGERQPDSAELRQLYVLLDQLNRLTDQVKDCLANVLIRTRSGGPADA